MAQHLNSSVEQMRNLKSVKIKEVVNALERFAPLPLQEDFDNAGLQVGLTETEVSGALLCLDVTEKVLDEAIALGCNLVVSHHPLVFRALKRVSDSNYVQVVHKVADAVYSYMRLSGKEQDIVRKKAWKLSEKAEWKHFFAYYREAYNIALTKVNNK